jgi:hypothetical protein
MRGTERAVPFRIFVAFRDGLAVAQAPPGAEEAVAIMMAGGYPADAAASLCLAAADSGRDPVAFARHFMDARKGLHG